MESAAIDFVRYAFGHLKAIAADKGGQMLLKAANVGKDAGVVDAKDKTLYRRVKDAPMGPGEIRANIGITDKRYTSNEPGRMWLINRERICSESYKY